MANLESAKTWSLVIERNDTTNNKVLENIKIIKELNLVCLHYYAILHDNDIDKDGVLKRPHYHIVCVFENVISRSRLLKVLSFVLEIPKEMISARPTISLVKELRYLIHLDNEDKYQYSRDLVFSDDKERYLSYIERKEYFSERTLIRIARNCQSKLDFICYIGMDFYEKHHYFCDLVWSSSIKYELY